MAATPNFAANPRVGSAVAATNTARDGSGTLATVITAGTGGTKVSEIVVKATGQPADSVLALFVHDGAAAHLFDEVDIGTPAAASDTAAGYRTVLRYDNLVLPATMSLRVAVTVAPTAGDIEVIAFGADL